MTHKNLPKPSSPNKQIQEYIAAVEKGYNSLFVIPVKNSWAVRHSNSGTIQETFATKTAAVNGAKKLASSSKTEIFVFGKEGQLLSGTPQRTPIKP